MATNPMQRKARNAFLLGMLLTLLITGLIIAFLFMQLLNMKKAEQELEQSYIKVYVLSKDIKSGGEITLSDLKQTEVVKTNAPKDYLTPSDLGEKNIAKIALTAGTVISKEMVYVDEEQTGNDIRKEEYNMIVLPSQIQTGDYIDVRIRFPNGQNFIVVSKKQVEIPQIAGIDSEDTIWMELSEDEILMMSNAIVEAYRVKGTELYATTYSEPGIQEAATPTYLINKDVMAAVEANPNIVTEAKNALYSRYNVQIRNDYINSVINSAGDQGQTNVETKVEESITNSKSTRKEYLDSLSGGTN